MFEALIGICLIYMIEGEEIPNCHAERLRAETHAACEALVEHRRSFWEEIEMVRNEQAARTGNVVLVKQQFISPGCERERKERAA